MSPQCRMTGENTVGTIFPQIPSILNLFSSPEKRQCPLIIIEPQRCSWALNILGTCFSLGLLKSTPWLDWTGLNCVLSVQSIFRWRSNSANPGQPSVSISADSSLLVALLCTWHWNRNVFLFESADILMLNFQFLLPMTGDFLYSYLSVAQKYPCLFLLFQLSVLFINRCTL